MTELGGSKPADGQSAASYPDAASLASSKPRSSSSCSKQDRGSDGLFTAAALLPALLASSCCIPQLLMTLTLGFGCLGFSALTPFRPLFLALTAIAAVAVVQSRGWRWRTIVLLLLTVFIAFSDVIIREYNEGDMQAAAAETKLFGRHLPAWLSVVLTPPRWVPPARLLLKPPRRAYPYSPPTATREQLTASGPKSVPPQRARVTLNVPTIGCDACAARVKLGLVNKFGKQLTSVEVWQKSKTVVLNLANQAALNDAALHAAMVELQFPASSIRRDLL